MQWKNKCGWEASSHTHTHTSARNTANLWSDLTWHDLTLRGMIHKNKSKTHLNGWCVVGNYPDFLFPNTSSELEARFLPALMVEGNQVERKKTTPFLSMNYEFGWDTKFLSWNMSGVLLGPSPLLLLLVIPPPLLLIPPPPIWPWPWPWPPWPWPAVITPLLSVGASGALFDFLLWLLLLAMTVASGDEGLDFGP